MICLAPKTYAYLLLQPENGSTRVIHNKGFRAEVTDKVNIEAFIDLYHDAGKSITVENKKFFLKNRREGTIHMKTLLKSFSYKYDKRSVVNDNQTEPWGYVR